MIRFSELTGLLAGLALFLGTLYAAQALVSHHGPEVSASLLVEDLD
jgi:hypothetical protein